MNKKKMLKKFVAFSASAAMLVAATATASAANYSTRTLYVAGSTDKIEVKTTVTGLAANDEVTYLATTEAELNVSEPNVVYIDQYTATPDGNGTQTFTYTTDDSSIGATVKMAKSDASFTNGEVIAKADGDSGTIPAVTEDKILVTIKGDNYKSTAELLLTDIETADTLVLTIDETQLADKRITGLSYNNTPVEDLIIGDGTVSFTNPLKGTEPGTIEFALTAETVSLSAPVYAGGYKDLDYSDVIDGEPITGKAFSILADASACPTGLEVGIAVSQTSAISAGSVPADVEYLAAAGIGGDGKYAITLVDPNATDGDVYYYATYVKSAEGTYTYGTSGTVTLSEN